MRLPAEYLCVHRGQHASNVHKIEPQRQCAQDTNRLRSGF
jgi:hypothetical protein